MVSGSLQEKNNKYYVVMSYKDLMGKRKTKRVSTGILFNKGNKAIAERKMREITLDFEKQQDAIIIKDEPTGKEIIYFHTYMESWLQSIRPNIRENTFGSYQLIVNKKIVPHFKQKPVELKNLKAIHIQEFYEKLLKTRNIKTNTVKRVHANIRKALQDALKLGLVDINVADKVPQLKNEKYIAEYYDYDELNKLLEVIKGHEMELIYNIILHYGLRRSEALGLKWDVIDFTNNSMTIKRTVGNCNTEDGNKLYMCDGTKSEASHRTLPLLPHIKAALFTAMGEQNANKVKYKTSYSNSFDGYIFLDRVGNIYKPDRISRTFGRILKANSLKKIRLHDLRHSCASLLLNNGVNMKSIQEWLGHSNFGTTANIYSHLSSDNKNKTLDVLKDIGLKSNLNNKKNDDDNGNVIFR